MDKNLKTIIDIFKKAEIAANYDIYAGNDPYKIRVFCCSLKQLKFKNELPGTVLKVERLILDANREVVGRLITRTLAESITEDKKKSLERAGLNTDKIGIKNNVLTFLGQSYFVVDDHKLAPQPGIDEDIVNHLFLLTI